VAFTPLTIVSLERLYSELHGVRLRGYAVSSGEHFTGESTVAVPVFGPGGTVVAAAEAEVGRSDSDFELCRAALMVGSGALSRALAASQIERHPRSRATGPRIAEDLRAVGG